MIWRRLAANASTPLKRAYLSRQAERMLEYERRVCGEVDHVIAVSDIDARLMRDMYRISRVSAVPTGVDTDYFTPPKTTAAASRKWDLVFIGSMDYIPNIEGVRYFVREILPLIRGARPGTTLAVVGRKPPEEIAAMAGDPGITITGTVADIRPYLWDSAVSVVPLLSGGGTRLKIYESMAACLPVVSTTVGAEGLAIHPPHDIRLADTPDRFAAECVALLNSPADREAVACAGRRLAVESFSWDQVSRRFEALL
jgi:glycosyltransferase involved in cell wall biosynthesis